MKSKRRGIALAAALLAAMLLGGCGGQAAGTPSQTETLPPLETVPAVAPTKAPETAPPTQTPDPTEPSVPPAETAAPPAPTPASTPAAQETPAPTQPPAENPLPVEPEEVTVGETAYTCTLSVSCASVLDAMEKLEEGKEELIPEDGVVFPATEVTFYEGESVFNVLQREMKRNKIHFEFSNVPIYRSAYIEGIANLYEFDCGELSGWMYAVNGWYPNYGCSRYQLRDGDVVEWKYTCDLGDDIGGYNDLTAVE